MPYLQKLWFYCFLVGEDLFYSLLESPPIKNKYGSREELERNKISGLNHTHKQKGLAESFLICETNHKQLSGPMTQSTLIHYSKYITKHCISRTPIKN